MTLEEYLASSAYQVFLDEALRVAATKAVNSAPNDCWKIKRHQLHAISSVIQGAGLGGLIKLADNQKRKNTIPLNMEFWTYIDNLLNLNSTVTHRLGNYIRAELVQFGIIDDENELSDPKEQKQQRQKNKDQIQKVMAQCIGVYFEHFTCHCYYKKTKAGAN